MAANTEQLDLTKKSLEAMQMYDSGLLPRVKELGTGLNFSEAEDSARKLIEFYKRISISALADFPDQILLQIKARAENDFNIFEIIRNFKIEEHSNPSSVRQQYVDSVKTAYDSTFSTLHPYISYSLYNAADFSRLDAKARDTLNEITANASKVQKAINDVKKQAEDVLDKIRETAAEQGVSQQAIYFNSESENHKMESAYWNKAVILFACLLGLYAIGSLFIHKWEFLTPKSNYEMLQIALSKLLIFSVLTYLLIMSSKNYLNHKHNQIVNKHRQNALLTHTALLGAVSDSGVRDAIMLKAADCIFTPQITGYAHSQSSGDMSPSRSVVEMVSKHAAGE